MRLDLFYKTQIQQILLSLLPKSRFLPFLLSTAKDYGFSAV